MKRLRYISLTVAVLTVAILASINNGKAQAAPTNEDDTVTVAKPDQGDAQVAINEAQNSVNNAQAKAEAPDNAYPV